MKKAVFYVSVIVAVILFINILNILINDFSRLTDYGFGYLTGKVILLLLFSAIAFFTRKSVTQEN